MKTILNRFHLAFKLEPIIFASENIGSHDRHLQNEKSILLGCFVLEVTIGFEPMNNGVADRGLTTWLRHHIKLYAELLFFVKKQHPFEDVVLLERITGLEPATSTLARLRSTK